MTPQKKTNPWKSHSEHYKDALSYMKDRKEGKIFSYKTPWSKFNNASTQGIEFNTITVIGGRPASGKTLLVDQMIREGFKLNPGLNLRVLQFQFEMLGRTSKMREFSAVTKRTYKYLCSAEQEGLTITKAEFELCKQHAISAAKYPIDIVDEPMTVEGLRKCINDYMNHHAVTMAGGKKIYHNTVITLDHTVLVKKAEKETNKNETLYNLGEMCTELKKKYPIAFILLSQLNRDIDRPERNEQGKYGNYILESDIFAADALLQHADLVAGINRPAKRFIKFYGPERYIIEDDSVLVVHWLKARNGEIGMSFFKAEFHNMRIAEMETPGQDQSQNKK
ncbi:MAG: repb [Bacteroidota bacterium]|jgi:replicative DNA helicase